MKAAGDRARGRQQWESLSAAARLEEQLAQS